MAKWINRTAVKSQSATTTHSVPFGFTATAGSLLVVVACSPQVITTPTGYTNQASSNWNEFTGIYTKAAAGGETSISVTINAAAWPLGVTVYEFPSGCSWGGDAITGGAANDAACPVLSGLSGVNFTAGTIGGWDQVAGLTMSTTWTGTGNPVKDTDDNEDWTNSYTGYHYSIGYVEDSTATSFQPTGTPTNYTAGDGKNAFTWAVKMPNPYEITLRAAGTAVAGSTTLSPAVPTGTITGDISVLTVAAKPYNATINTPTNWTKIGETTSGTTAQGADTGSMKVATFIRQSAPTGTVSVSVTSGNSCMAVINSYAKNASASWDFSAFTTGADTTHGTNFSATGAAGIDVAANDVILASIAVNTDAGTVSAFTLGGMAGATLAATTTMRSAGTTTTNNDCRIFVAERAVTGGSSTAAPTMTYTNASSSQGAVLFLRLRTTVPVPAAPAWAPTAASFQNSYNLTTSTLSTVSLTTPAFTPAAGEIIVVKQTAQSSSSYTAQEPTATGGGITWTNRVSFTDASKCPVHIWTGVVTVSQSLTVTARVASGRVDPRWHASVERWRWGVVSTAGTPAISTGTGAPSAPITTTKHNSIVTWVNADWDAIVGTTRTYRNAPTETWYQNTANDTIYHAYQQIASPWTVNLGLTVPSNQAWALGGVEITAEPWTATSTRTDDFEVDALASKWPASSGNYYINNGVLVLVSDDMSETTVVGSSNLGRYDLTNSYVSVKFTPSTIDTDPPYFAGLSLIGTADTDEISCRWNQGSITFGKRVSGLFTGATASTPLAGGASMYLGVAEGTGASRFGGTGTAGNVYFYTSPDAQTWTLRHTIPTPEYAVGVAFRMYSAREGMSFDTHSSDFDNFNVIPAAGAPNYNGTLGLTGSRTLGVSGTPAHNGSRTLTGTGATTGTGAPNPNGTRTLTGTGATTATGTPNPSATLAVGQAGALTASGIGGYSGSLTLTGTGATTGTGVPAITAAQTLTGTGALTRAGSAATSGSISLTQAGSSVVSGTPNPNGTLTRTQSGATTGTGVPAITAPLNLSGTGSLALPGSVQFSGSIALSQAGAVALVKDTHNINASRTLTGTGTLSVSAAALNLNAALNLSGTGSLALPGTAQHNGSVTLSQSGSTTVSGSPSGSGTAALGQAGALALSGAKSVSGTLALTGTGSVTGTGTVAVPGSVSLNGTGSLALPGTAQHNGSIGIGGSGALATTGTVHREATLSLGQAGSLTEVSGSPSVPGVLGRSGSGSLGLSGAVSASGSVSLSQVGSLARAGSPGQASALNIGQAGALSGTGVPAINSTLTRTGDGALGLSGDGSIDAYGSLELTATGTTTRDGSPAWADSIAMSGSTSLFQEADEITFDAELTLTGTLEWDGIGYPALEAALALTGDPDLGLDGAPGFSGSIDTGGSGGLDANQTAVSTGGTLSRSMARTLALVASAITAAGDLNLTGDQVLVLGGSASSDGVGSFTMVREGNLTLSGRAGLTGTLNRPGTGGLAVAGKMSTSGTLVLERTQRLYVDGEPATVGSLTLGVSGQWLLDGSPVVEGSLIIAGAGSVAYYGASDSSAMYLKNGTLLVAYILQGGQLIQVTPQIGANDGT